MFYSQVKSKAYLILNLVFTIYKNEYQHGKNIISAHKLRYINQK